MGSESDRLFDQYIHYIINLAAVDEYANVVFLKSKHLALARVNNFLSEATFETKHFYHLVFPFESPPPISDGNKKLYFNARKAVIFPPDNHYTIDKRLHRETNEYYYFILKRELVEEVIHTLYGTALTLNLSEYTPSSYTMDIIKRIELELKERPFGCNEMIKCLMHSALISIFRSKNITNDGGLSNYNSINQALEHIQSYYSADIQITEMACLCHCSPYHFIRQFKQLVGKSPYQYLIDYRLKKAVEMMQQSDLSLIEISKSCGFVNPSHFSNLFKKKYHQTPSAHRQGLRNINQ